MFKLIKAFFEKYTKRKCEDCEYSLAVGNHSPCYECWLGSSFKERGAE